MVLMREGQFLRIVLPRSMRVWHHHAVLSMPMVLLLNMILLRLPHPVHATSMLRLPR